MIGETEVSQRNGAPPKLAGTFPLAILLSCAGGYLDAFTWVGQGGVFANAQTGNVVLLGINVATGQWSEALRHLMPIIAFVVGVFAAFWIRSLASARGEPWINLISLLLELAVLIVVAFLPTGSSSMPIVLAISFVASIQSSIFTKLDKWSYNSVIATGNLRRATESLFRGVSRHRDTGDLEQSKKFGAVSLSFLAGAGLGAVATNFFGNATTAGAAVLLTFALLLCLRTGRRGVGTEFPF